MPNPFNRAVPSLPTGVRTSQHFRFQQRAKADVRDRAAEQQNRVVLQGGGQHDLRPLGLESARCESQDAGALERKSI